MSCSSSKSPSPSPTYHYHHHRHLSPPSPGPSPSKSMDEVWKDLSLSSFHNHHQRSTTTHNATTNTHPASFHDLLTPPPPPAADPPPHRIPLNLNLNSSRHPPPADHDMGMGARRTTHINALPSLAPPFNVLAAASPLLPSLRKRRPRGGDDDNSGDRRHNRLMKNRESAARSRARKQAYTNELELEVAHLIEENAKLKKLQQKQFCPAAPSQLPKKHALYRTLTAPF